MKKIVALFLIPVIALSMVGASYALWSKTVTITGTVETGTVEKKIIEIFCAEALEAEGKDVGKCIVPDVLPPEGVEEVEVKLGNVYPSYKVDVTFKEVNSGTIPLFINDVLMTLYDSDGNVVASATCKPSDISCKIPGPIEIAYMDNWDNQIDPGEVIANSVNIHVLQDTVQGTSYKLILKERAVQWNEYPAP